MPLQYQAWLCPPLRDTGIRVGQGGFHAVGELIGQSGWYAFERINNDGQGLRQRLLQLQLKNRLKRKRSAVPMSKRR